MSGNREVERGNKNYFFCYTKMLSDYLRDRGHKPITVAMEPKTKQIFSLYFITEELSDSIDLFKTRKNKK